MEQTIVNIQNRGIYLFGKNTRVSSHLDQELLVVLWSEENKMAGLAYIDESARPIDIADMLERLITQIKDKQSNPNAKIEIKCFGSSHYRQDKIQAIQNWIQKNNLPIKAVDLGKGSVRKVIIDCSNGQVGITYSESDHSKRAVQRNFGT